MSSNQHIRHSVFRRGKSIDIQNTSITLAFTCNALQVAVGADNYLARNLHPTNSNGSSSVTRLSNRPGNCRLSLRTAVERWLSDTSTAAMTQGVNTSVPTADEAGSQTVVGVASEASNAFSHISATSTPPGLVGSQAIGANASSMSGPSIRSAPRTSTPVPGSFSDISAASLASEAISSQTLSRSVSTISEASSHSEFGTDPPLPRTSTGQNSGTIVRAFAYISRVNRAYNIHACWNNRTNISLQSFTFVDGRPHNGCATSAEPTPSRRIPTELKFDLPEPGRRNMRSTRDGDARPRLTATEIQKLLVIPKVLITQKDCKISKAGSRSVPPWPLKERHHNGEQVEDARPKLTVTELQKRFVIPKGLVTQKQYGKKAPGRTTKYGTLMLKTLAGHLVVHLLSNLLILINIDSSCSCLTSSFAKGSYAGRLAEMMHYHRSKYSIWANATIRERTCSSFSVFCQSFLSSSEEHYLPARFSLIILYSQTLGIYRACRRDRSYVDIEKYASSMGQVQGDFQQQDQASLWTHLNKDPIGT